MRMHSLGNEPRHRPNSLPMHCTAYQQHSGSMADAWQAEHGHRCSGWVLCCCSARYMLGVPQAVSACRLIMFGGRNQEGRRLNDVWALDLGTWVWSRMPTMGAVPAPRHSAAAVVHAGRFIIFGGSSASSRLNDVWILDLGAEMPAWKQIVTGSTGLGLRHSAGHCVHGQILH